MVVFRIRICFPVSWSPFLRIQGIRIRIKINEIRIHIKRNSWSSTSSKWHNLLRCYADPGSKKSAGRKRKIKIYKFTWKIMVVLFVLKKVIFQSISFKQEIFQLLYIRNTGNVLIQVFALFLHYLANFWRFLPPGSGFRRFPMTYGYVRIRIHIILFTTILIKPKTAKELFSKEYWAASSVYLVKKVQVIKIRFGARFDSWQTLNILKEHFWHGTGYWGCGM